jgi:DNA-binding MarR family transcriptional regulator
MQPSATADDVMILLSMARRRIKQTVSSRLGSFELGSQQLWVLLTLRKEGGLSLHELARRTWTDDPTACRMVGKLTERGIIRSDEDPEDRRRFRLMLTAKGRKLADEMETFATELRATVVRGLSGDDRQQLCRLLRKVTGNMDVMADDPGAYDALVAPKVAAKSSRTAVKARRSA